METRVQAEPDTGAGTTVQEILTDDDKREENYSKRVEENYSRRMETKQDKLRQKWSGTNYEIVCEKLEGLMDWVQEDGGEEVREALMDWLLENDELTLVEESEDIVDGLETMKVEGEISEKLLLDSTEIITLIIARNLCPRTMPTTFLKDGNSGNLKRSEDSSGKGRLERMMRMREILTKSKEERKPKYSRMVRDEDFPELEIGYVSRRKSSRRMESMGILSNSVNNDLIQDRNQKLKIVG